MSKIKMPEVIWEDDDENADGAEESTQEFASMLDASDSPVDDFRVGDKVKGVIVSVSEQSPDVIVDIGAKGTAVIPKEELLESNAEVRAGSQIEAVIVSRRGGDILLSTSLAKGMQAAADLQNAMAGRIPVKGKVSGENKGGFDVQVFGKKAFCPVSQMDLSFVEDKSKYIGREFNFLITGLRGKDITVSRRSLLEEEAKARLDRILANLETENVFDGTVTRLEKFGAFVDLGSGLEGLVHVSEITHGRLAHASEVLQSGDRVRVKVLEAKKADDGKVRLSLSLRALADDPWDRIDEKYGIGGRYSGKVVSLMNFGAFVELERGVEGLIHVSEMSWNKRVNHPKEVVAVGDLVSVNIVKINRDTRQIGLSLKDVESDPWQLVGEKFPVGAVVKGTVVRLKGFGSIVQLAEGVEAMLPVSIMRKAQGDAFRKHFSPPKEVDVVVSRIEADSRRILLTLPDMDDDEEGSRDWAEYLKERGQKDDGSTVMPMAAGPATGSFGELLKQSMDRKPSR